MMSGGRVSPPAGHREELLMTFIRFYLVYFYNLSAHHHPQALQHKDVTEETKLSFMIHLFSSSMFFSFKHFVINL